MLNTVKKTFEVAKHIGDHLVAQVKGNQPELHHAVQHVAAQAAPWWCAFVSYEHEARSRIEYRKVTAFKPQENALPKRWRTHLQAVIEAQRGTETFQTQTGTWQKRQDTAFYPYVPG